MSLANGLLNLTNWLGNVIMPTMAGLFAAAAIYHFSKAQPLSTPRLRGTGLSDVLWACCGRWSPSAARQLGTIQTATGSRPDARELGRQCSAAALWVLARSCWR